MFEFADLRGVKMIDTNFAHANFVGASLLEAKATACNFHEADFYWAEIEAFVMTRCNIEGARFPEKVKVAYGHKGVKPPNVKPVPLYREAATAAERKNLLEAVMEIRDSRREGP